MFMTPELLLGVFGILLGAAILWSRRHLETKYEILRASEEAYPHEIQQTVEKYFHKELNFFEIFAKMIYSLYCGIGYAFLAAGILVTFLCEAKHL